jgi:hypothetical protein
MLKNKLLTLLLISLNIGFCFSQQVSQFDKVSSDEIRDKGVVLNTDEKRILFNKEFTSALSSTAINYIGNYASLDLKAAKASFATSFVREGSILGFNFSGATSDKTLRFINNNKLNYNFDFGFQYHFIDASKKIKVEIDATDLESIRLTKIKIKEDSRKKIKDLTDEKNIEPFHKEVKKILNDIKTIDEKIENIAILNFLTKGKSPTSIEKEALKLTIKGKKLKESQYAEYLDYLKFPLNVTLPYYKSKKAKLDKIKDCYTDACILEKINLENDVAFKKMSLHRIEFKSDLKDLEEKLTNFKSSAQKIALQTKKVELQGKLNVVKQKIIDLKSKNISFIRLEHLKRQEALIKHAKKSVKTYGSKFNWFSIGFKTSLKSFTLFDDQLPLENQFIAKESMNSELLLQYSWHSRNKKNNWKSYLVNAGLSITYGDNSHLLSSKVIEDQKTITATNGTTRTTKDQTNVLIGTYQKDIVGAALFTDMYYFLFKGNFAAIHFYPKATFIQGEKTLFTSELGLLLSFKDEKDTSALVNAELFYALNDIGNKFDSELNLLGRNTIGLRLTVPLKFK